jgi:hypothetical protein
MVTHPEAGKKYRYGPGGGRQFIVTVRKGSPPEPGVVAERLA